MATSRGPGQFAQRIIIRANQVLTRSAMATAGAATAIGTRLVDVTPLKTGLARSNWLAAVEAVDLSPRRPRSPSDTKGEIRAKAQKVEADQSVSVANGGDKVPYIKALNDGSSAQAPKGFVQEAVLAGVRWLEKARLLERQ